MLQFPTTNTSALFWPCFELRMRRIAGLPPTSRLITIFIAAKSTFILLCHHNQTRFVKGLFSTKRNNEKSTKSPLSSQRTVKTRVSIALRPQFRREIFELLSTQLPSLSR